MSAAPTAERAGPRSRLRGWRGPAAVAALLLAVLVTGALLVPRSSGAALDPDNPDPRGSRALAQVLAERGVDVTLVRSTQDAVALADSGSTLLVARTGLLSPDRLDALAATGADLVLVEPDAVALERLAPGLEPAGTAEPTVTGPSCAAPGPTTAGDALAGGVTYRARQDTPAALCYPVPSAGASYAVTDQDGRRVVVLGQSRVLTNADVAQQGNAALALHTLGRHERLTWYLPSPLEGPVGEDPAALDLLPPAVPRVGVALLLTFGVLVLWRARRLGPLVAEPLPVVVRAAETTQGRAGLYRRSRARGRVADTLRAACLRRIATRSRLGRFATAEDVVAAAAQASGRDRAEVEMLLRGLAPPDDAALARLADDLDALEKEVARP